MKHTLLLALACIMSIASVSAQCDQQAVFSIGQVNNTITPYFFAPNENAVAISLQYDFGDGTLQSASPSETISHTYSAIGEYSMCITTIWDMVDTPDSPDCSNTTCYVITVDCITPMIYITSVEYNSDGTATVIFDAPGSSAMTQWNSYCWPGIILPDNNPSDAIFIVDFQGNAFAGIGIALTDNASPACIPDYVQFVVDNPAVSCQMQVTPLVVNNVASFEVQITNGTNSVYYPYGSIDFGDGTSISGTELSNEIDHAYTTIGTYEACFYSQPFFEDSCPDTACVTIVVDSLDLGCNAQFTYSAGVGGWISLDNTSTGYYTETSWLVGDSILATTDAASVYLGTNWPYDVTLLISNSITGCSSSITQTIDINNETFSICGTLYYDTVDNNFFDQGDAGLPFETLEIWLDNSIFTTVITDAEGHYCIDLPTTFSFYTLVPTISSAPGASFYPAFVNYSGAWSNQTGTMDFGTNFTIGAPDATLSCNGFGFISAANGGWASIYLTNASDQTIASNLQVHIGANAHFVNSSIAGVMSSDHHDFTAPITLLPFQSMMIYMNLSIDASIPVGTLETLSASFDVTGDVDPSDNTCQSTLTVLAAYDPNNKLVEPRGEGSFGHIAPDTEWLTYTINFQNTGSAPAINIRIEDLIANTLDLTSFQMLSSSHPCTASIADNTITWHFNDIYLPDSASNEPASKGFLQFRIKITAGLTLLSTIENHAAIFFDYNEPIITNTAINTLFDTVQGLDEQSNSTWRIYPNPADRILQLSADQPVVRIRLYDLQGRIVFQVQNSSAIQQLELPDLPEGIYTLEGHTEKENFRQKLLIEHR